MQLLRGEEPAARHPGERARSGAADGHLARREVASAGDEPTHLLRERAEQHERRDADGDAAHREHAPHATAAEVAERLAEREHGAVGF